MRVAVGTDEVTSVSETVKAALVGQGHEVVLAVDGDAWPEVGRRVGEAVADGSADIGVVSCWTGTGVSIAANKVPGVRAALCTDAETARGARRWNDANVLAIGARVTPPERALDLVRLFLKTEFEGGRHAKRIEKLG